MALFLLSVKFKTIRKSEVFIYRLVGCSVFDQSFFCHIGYCNKVTEKLYHF